MSNDPHQLVVRTVCDNATAQLRAVAGVADREEARRMSAELKRIASILDRKYNFPGRQQVMVKLNEADG